MADLDMTAVSWTPLGYGSDNAFEGTFYGGHAIRIYISNTDDNYQGLFAKIGTSGKVQNLHLTGEINVGNARKVGGIAGVNHGMIENCWVSADITSSHYSGYDADLGGIAGWNESGATIQFCCMTGNVQNTGENYGVGGIAGSNDGTIQHCTFYGSVSVDHSQDNIYVGDQDGTVNDLRDTYDDTHYSAASEYGMYAYAYKYPYSVTVNTIGHGSIQTAAAGEYDVPGTRAVETFTLHVTSGSVARLTITDADGNDVPLQGQANDGSSYWFIMPHKNITATFVFYEDWPTQGNGTVDYPYLISSADDWNKFAHNVTYGRNYSGQYVKLTDDISVSTSAGSCNAADDTDYKPFSGTFDGDGHTLTVNLSNQSRFGAPFKCVENATIENLRTAGTIDGTGNETGKLLSGLVGISFGNTTITGCVSSATLTTNFGDDAALAGFVAGTKGGSLTVSGCVFDGSMTGANNQHCAGIAGYEYPNVGGTNTTISNCLFAPTTLTVNTADDGSTKTISRDADATITNCYYTQTLGTAQGTAAVANTFFLNELGSLVQDYGLVRVFQRGMFSGGKAYIIPGSISCAGTAEDPYIISNDENWNRFTTFVNGGTTYSGKYVKLMADINVSDMAGANETNSFQGTFLGNGHTLTFTKGSAESAFDEEYCAPFRHVNNATIQDLKVAGAIYTSRKFTAGLVAHSYGTTNITDCQVGTFIHSILNGDGTHGGIVSMPSGTLNIEGCAYTGRLLTNNGTDRCSGFVAWHNDATIRFINSIYAPSGDIPSGWSAINNGATYVREGSPSFSNCYYTQTMGGAQGTLIWTLSATSPSNLGELVQEYNLLKAYDNGILLNGTYYLGPAHFSGTGTSENPYLISNDYEWRSFAFYVNNGNGYSGRFVGLGADISVSEMVGSSEGNSFQGTFLGNGHTLTFTKGSAESPFGEENCAPFRHVKNAKIQDLKVAGAIYTSRKFAAGLVAHSYGYSYIINCQIGTVIYSHVNGDGTHGGIVSYLHWSLYIEGCTYTGRLLTDNGTTKCGGIMGWNGYIYMTVVNSLYAPSGDIPSGWSAIDNGATILRDDDPNNYQIRNCYYTETLGEAQGTRAYATVPDNEIGLKITIGDTTVYPICTIRGIYTFRGIDTLYGLLPVSITPTTTYSNFTLGTGYTATLDGEAVTETPIIFDTFGDYTLVITGTGNYEGSKTFQIPVARLLEGEGTEQSPYLIGSTREWEGFCTLVANGNSFSGKYVKMTADIDISTTVGLRGDKPFSGTFLGDGHTLTTNIRSTSTYSDVNEQGVAPFHYINGATIKDLTVAGTIASASWHTGGLVGFADGTNLIKNCAVTATLNISSDYAGGIVGHGLNSTTTIQGCVFAGTINGFIRRRDYIGGIWGWSDSGTPTLEDCMEAGTYTNIASMHPMGLQGGSGTITNCYYVNPQVGSPSNAYTVSGASQVYTITPGDYVTVANAGAVSKEYSVSGLTFYAAGLQCGSMLYAASGDAVSLNLSSSAPSAEYHASAGTLSGSENPYTLTMPGGNVVIGMHALQSIGSTVWYAIATPMHDDGQVYESIVNVTNLTTDNYDLLRYDEASGTWENQKANGGATGFSTLEPGRGYIYRCSEARTLTYTGVPNSEESYCVSLTADGTSDLKGFNLVGNPYPFSVTMYRPFYSLGADGIWQAHASGESLEAGQGALVYATSDEPLIFYAATRSTNPGTKGYMPPLPKGLCLNGNTQDSYSTHSTHFAHQDGNSIVVTGTGTLQAYDIMGRLLFRMELPTANYQLPTTNFPSTGVYILRLGGKSQKIVIK